MWPGKTVDDVARQAEAADRSGADQLILDENRLAEGKDYFRLGAAEVSPDGKLLAYAYDDNGSERFDLHVRNLETGEELADIIPGAGAWPRRCRA